MITKEDIRTSLKDSKYADYMSKVYKAMGIIIAKNVDIRWLDLCDTVKDYNKGKDDHFNYELTKEEFDLLKEVITNESIRED